MQTTEDQMKTVEISLLGRIGSSPNNRCMFKNDELRSKTPYLNDMERKGLIQEGEICKEYIIYGLTPIGRKVNNRIVEQMDAALQISLEHLM